MGNQGGLDIVPPPLPPATTTHKHQNQKAIVSTIAPELPAIVSTIAPE